MQVNFMNMIKKSITVTETQNDWIKSQLQSGHYASDSELLRDLIRKEQARNNEIQAIRQALLESEESGLSNKTPQEILNDFKKQRSLNV
jgi:antitoxin ParD1/3/4